MATTAPKEIRDWLSEFKTRKEGEYASYSASLKQKKALLLEQLTRLIEDGLGGQWLEPVCHQLFDLFKSGEPDLRRFTLELIPPVLLAYLSAVSRGEKRKCMGLEACLLGIYNLEIVDKSGKPKKIQHTIPSLAVPSIYHEPPSIASMNFTETLLWRYHREEPVTTSQPPHKPRSAITIQNRQEIVTFVLSVYHDEIALLGTQSHLYFCQLCSKLCRLGFPHLDDLQTGLVAVRLNDSLSSIPSSRGSRRSLASTSGHTGASIGTHATQARVPLSAPLLVQLLNSVYFVIFNGHAMRGIEALELIHTRASYEMYPSVLLVTNAIRNSLRANPSGQPEDGPMGISVALSPAQRDDSFSKHAITNASFRAKKLPEDIDIVNKGEDTDAPPQYHDLIDADRLDKPPSLSTQTSVEKGASGSSSSKSSKNPLKSIMKKSSMREEKRQAVAASRSGREAVRSGSSVSDATGGSGSPKSPKHSGISASEIDGVLDPASVHLSGLHTGETDSSPVLHHQIGHQKASKHGAVVANGELSGTAVDEQNGEFLVDTDYPQDGQIHLSRLIEEETDEKTQSSNGSMNTAL